ncbi:hypothetical protein SteCoe_26235 [Stentor coeruleus]|uniref:MARVEL domain-containing protein n=1 Tax=Stentor coeruleus TaxID=5963 RepID=A0A1R2BDD0_9CILI|nr:hypothetical protein SteCoe_26235 [Stentor coeruleus]
MTITPLERCFCFSLSFSCAVISIIQFVKAFAAFIIALYYLANQGLYPLAVHHIFLFFLFFICCGFASAVLVNLRNKSYHPLPFVRLYKCLYIIDIIWLIEYCLMIGILMILKEDMKYLLVYGCPSAVCLLLDIFFSYCLYSFAKQSLRKMPNQVVPKLNVFTVTNSVKDKNFHVSKKKLSKSVPEFEDNTTCNDMVKSRLSVV